MIFSCWIARAGDDSWLYPGAIIFANHEISASYQQRKCVFNSMNLRAATSVVREIPGKEALNSAFHLQLLPFRCTICKALYLRCRICRADISRVEMTETKKTRLSCDTTQFCLSIREKFILSYFVVLIMWQIHNFHPAPVSASRS